MEDLIGDVDDLGFENGAANSLTSKLLSALKSLDKGNAGPAKKQFGAFINEVEALEKRVQLTEAEADDLIADADAIIAGL